MASTSILTTYGEQLITNAIASGTTINLPTFIISSNNSFSLTPDLVTLPDIVYTSSEASLFSVVKVATNTVEFRVYLTTAIGDFNIGTIGILDNTGKLVAAGQLDQIIEKKETTNSQEGNTLQFKLPVNIENASQLVTSISQEFQVDNVTVLIDAEGTITSGVVPHHVFDIFQNASTSNPPGALPLWTGETVYCNGAHEEFYAKAVEYASNGYIRSISTSTYNSEVSSQGWTNGFVINSSNKSIRLPKFKGVLYMNDPTVATTTAATASSNTNYGFITLPTYIQIDTAAVPATVAQCNAFNEALEDFATQFVTLATVQTVTANKTWSGIQTFNNNVTIALDKTLTNNGTSVLAGTNTLSGATSISGALLVSSNGTFSGSTYSAGGNWTFPNLINGTAYAAQYRDLAEYYKADKVYPAGTLIEFGGDNEITVACGMVNGVISTEAGVYLGTKQDELDLPVAMTGKVPVRIIGKVKKFELVASNSDGTASAYSPIKHNQDLIIGRTLEANSNEEEKLVLCVTHMKL